MNTGLSVRDRIHYMEMMLKWFEKIHLCEDLDNPIRWKRGEGYYALTTPNIIHTLTDRIRQYKLGVSNGVLERDKDTINSFIQFYNINKRLNTLVGTLITTI